MGKDCSLDVAQESNTVKLIVLASNHENNVIAADSAESLLLGAPSEDARRIAIVGTLSRIDIRNDEFWQDIVTLLLPFAQDTPPQEVDRTPNIPTTWYSPRIFVDVEAKVELTRNDLHFTLGGRGGTGYRLHCESVKGAFDDQELSRATSEEELINRFNLPSPEKTKIARQLNMFDTPSAVRRGRLHVIFGCMFSGKSTELINEIRRLRGEGHSVMVIRPSDDTRSPIGFLETHDGVRYEAFRVSNPRELAHLMHERYDSYIAIDEVQFFDEDFVDVCSDLLDRGHNLIVAGLDLDFRRVPFGSMPQLIAMSDSRKKLEAECFCGERAFFSQRLVDGRPASFFEKIIVPGGADSYQPRCHAHHEVPGKRLKLVRGSSKQPERDSHTPLLDWAQRLRALCRIGLRFSNDTYDRERYNEGLELVSEMAECLPDSQRSSLLSIDRESTIGEDNRFEYVTPKVAVAIAAFDSRNAILLVRRTDNGQWALPGGWADVGFTPAENAERELYQETGLYAQCDGFTGVYDGRLNPVGASLEFLYTHLFHAHLIDGEIKTHRLEVHDAQFFLQDELRLLTLTAGARKQIYDSIAFHASPRSAYFDRSI